MKAKVILVALSIAVAGLVAPAGAQTDADQPAKGEPLRQQFLEERAEVLSQVFEKRAELVRLSAKKVPDVKEVQRLVKEISELRSGLWKKCAEYRATAAALGQPAVPVTPAFGARRWGSGPRRGYNVGRGQGSRRSRDGRRRPQRRQGFRPGRGQAASAAGVKGQGARARGRGFGVGRGQASPAPGARGRGAPARRRASAPGRGRAAPGPGVRGRGGLGSGFGRPAGGMMGGRGMRPWGAGPLSEDASDEPAPPSK